MQLINRYPVVVSLLSWFIGLVFIWAGLTKLVAMPEISLRKQGLVWNWPQSGWLVPAEAFAKAIKNYRMLPTVVCRFLAVTLPWIEITAGVALMTRRYRYEAALIVSGLLVVFTIGITRALIGKLDISCGCFSLSPKARRIGIETLLVDIALLIVTCLIIWWMENQRRTAARR